MGFEHTTTCLRGRCSIDQLHVISVARIVCLAEAGPDEIKRWETSSPGGRKLDGVGYQMETELYSPAHWYVQGVGSAVHRKCDWMEDYKFPKCRGG